MPGLGGLSGLVDRQWRRIRWVQPPANADRELRPGLWFLRRFHCLPDVFDFFGRRFPPVLAAEALWPALWTLAQLPRPEPCTKHPPSPETGDAPERC